MLTLIWIITSFWSVSDAHSASLGLGTCALTPQIKRRRQQRELPSQEHQASKTDRKADFSLGFGDEVLAPLTPRQVSISNGIES